MARNAMRKHWRVFAFWRHATRNAQCSLKSPTGIRTCIRVEWDEIILLFILMKLFGFYGKQFNVLSDKPSVIRFSFRWSDRTQWNRVAWVRLNPNESDCSLPTAAVIFIWPVYFHFSVFNVTLLHFPVRKSHSMQHTQAKITVSATSSVSRQFQIPFIQKFMIIIMCTDMRAKSQQFKF